jgi:hypothetical protein
MKLIKRIINWIIGLFRHKPQAMAAAVKVFERRSAKETRSLLLNLRPGDLLFDRDGNCLVVTNLRTRRKKGAVVEQENGRNLRVIMPALERRYVDTEPLVCD